MLLRYLVENALKGGIERLKERTIGVELFHRDASYDTGQDAIVRVAANDVRKRLATHYQVQTRGAMAQMSGSRWRLDPTFRSSRSKSPFQFPVPENAPATCFQLPGVERRRRVWVPWAIAARWPRAA